MERARSASPGNVYVDVRFCPSCRHATTFTRDGAGFEFQIPGFLPGQGFDPSDKEDQVQTLVALYDDARWAMSTGAASCAVLMFRKMLMHIAVEKGAAKGLRFVQYCDYLIDENVVATPQHVILTRIKDAGNLENHAIRRAAGEEAEDLLALMTHLINGIYFM